MVRKHEIHVHRGSKANLPTLLAGEPAFLSDKKRFVVGDGSNNFEVGKGIHTILVAPELGDYDSVASGVAAATAGDIVAIAPGDYTSEPNVTVPAGVIVKSLVTEEGVTQGTDQTVKVGFIANAILTLGANSVVDGLCVNFSISTDKAYIVPADNAVLKNSVISISGSNYYTLFGIAAGQDGFKVQNCRLLDSGWIKDICPSVSVAHVEFDGFYIKGVACREGVGLFKTEPADNGYIGYKNIYVETDVSLGIPSGRVFYVLSGFNDAALLLSNVNVFDENGCFHIGVDVGGQGCILENVKVSGMASTGVRVSGAINGSNITAHNSGVGLLVTSGSVNIHGIHISDCDGTDGGVYAGSTDGVLSGITVKDCANRDIYVVSSETVISDFNCSGNVEVITDDNILCSGRVEGNFTVAASAERNIISNVRVGGTYTDSGDDTKRNMRKTELGIAPTVDEDETKGYEKGDIVTVGTAVYLCLDPATGAADWQDVVLGRETLLSGSSGLVWGGKITPNADPTKFDIAAGSAVIIDAFTDPQNRTEVLVSWDAKIGVTPALLSSSAGSFIYIDSDEEIVEEPALDREDYRDYCLLGNVGHSNLTTVTSIHNFPRVRTDFQSSFEDLIVLLGSSLKASGAAFSANGSNLQIDRAEGTFFTPGFNYHNNNKDPNVAVVSGETAVGFLLVQRTAGASIFTPTNSVPTDKYDPNGDGVLVDIPDGYFATHRIYYTPVGNLTLVQYGQYAYDSLKKAFNNYDKEFYDKALELETIPSSAAIIVKKGTTDLTDVTKAKFANFGVLSDLDFNSVESSSQFVEPVEVVDALSYQKHTIYLEESGGTIYLDVEAVGGGDLTYAFEQREYFLDCTGGSGESGRARVALTAGTASNPQKNYIYTERSGTDIILSSSTSEPSGEHGMIGTAILPDVTTFTNRDAYGSRGWNNAKEADGIGIIASILRKLRDLPSKYLSGLNTAVIISAGPDPDSVDVTISAGEVREIFDQATDALQLSADGALVVNDETTSFVPVSDINELTTDATGGSLTGNNTYFQVVVAISTNTSGKTQLLLNKPSGSYSTAKEAFDDVQGYSTTTFPTEFDTVALVCALVLRYQTLDSGTYTNAASAFGVNCIDLRGQDPGASAGGSGAASLTEFSDGTFRVFNEADPTKEIQMDVSGVSAGQSRLLIASDADMKPLTETQNTDLTDTGNTTLHLHDSDRARANHTGTQPASTISDFDTEVSNNTDVDANTTYRGVGHIPVSQKGAVSGVAELDGAGLVPAAQLPSYVDDVLEYADLGSFPGTGETGKVYVAIDTSLTYRWSGSIYVELGGSGHVHTNKTQLDLVTDGDHDVRTDNPHGVDYTDTGAEPAFSKNTAFNVDFGTGSGDACEGDDGRLSDSRTPTAHDLSGSLHNSSTRAALNAKISDGNIGEADKVLETGGPTVLTVGAIADKQVAARVGSTFVGKTPKYTLTITAGDALNIIQAGDIPGYERLPQNTPLKLVKVTVMGNHATGTIEFDIRAGAIGSLLSLSSIVGTNKPAISSDDYTEITVLTGWTTTFLAETCFEAEVKASPTPANFTFATVKLEFEAN